MISRVDVLAHWHKRLKDVLPAAAFNFCVAYTSLVNQVDDIVDEEKDDEFILDTFDLAESVYSCEYYVRHQSVLRPVDKVVNNAYADSVKWECGEDTRLGEASRTLKLVGIEMILMVVRIECGRVKLRELSEELRRGMFQCHPENLITTVGVN